MWRNCSPRDYPPDYEHLLLCNGQTINADDYPELVAALGTNVLPNLNGRVLQGAETAGEYKEAGLPDIVSWGPSQWFANYNDLGTWKANTDYDFGALTVHTWSSRCSDQSLNSNGIGFNGRYAFNASKSNAIYGNSSTVQPPAYTVRYYICYG